MLTSIIALKDGFWYTIVIAENYDFIGGWLSLA